MKSFNKQDTFCYNSFTKCFITQHHLFSYVSRYDASSKNMMAMVWSHLYPSSQVRITLFHRKQIWDFLKYFRSIQPAVKIVAKTLLLFGTVQFGYLRDTPFFYPNCFWLKTNPFGCCKGCPSSVSDYSGGRNFIEALKFKHLQLSLVEAFHNLGASHNHQHTRAYIKCQLHQIG